MFEKDLKRDTILTLAHINHGQDGILHFAMQYSEFKGPDDVLRWQRWMTGKAMKPYRQQIAEEINRYAETRR